MAELVGVIASSIQIAGFGAKLSTALYHYTTSAARADQSITDIAGDVELTSNALESISKVFELDNDKSIVTAKAIQDASNIIKRCETVFSDITQLIEQRRTVGKDGKRKSSMFAKLSWPLNEQRVELHRRRLDSLKNSLLLLLHVLQLAQGQARGQLEKTTFEEEREKIRELHQRQQDSLKYLQVLEKGFREINLDNDDLQHTESRVASAIPTSAFMVHPNPPVAPNDYSLLNMAGLQRNCKSRNITTMPDSTEATYNDSIVADDEDDDEQLILEELTKATKHIQIFLERITELQEDIGMYGSGCMEQQVHMLYRRFCRKWESNIFGTSKAPSASTIDTLPTNKRRHNFDGGQSENISDTMLKRMPFVMPKHPSHAVPQLAQDDARGLISNEFACEPYRGVELQDTISMVNESDELSGNEQNTPSMRGRKRKPLVLPTTLFDRQVSPARCLHPPALPLEKSKPRLPSGYRDTPSSMATSNGRSTGASSPKSPGPGIGGWAPEYHFSEAPLRLSSPTALGHKQSVTGSQSETALVSSSAPSWPRQRSEFGGAQGECRSPPTSDFISRTGYNVARFSHGEEAAGHRGDFDYSRNASLDECEEWRQRWSKRSADISDEHKGTQTGETEVDTRDIVDVLLEQWTIQVD